VPEVKPPSPSASSHSAEAIGKVNHDRKLRVGLAHEGALFPLSPHSRVRAYSGSDSIRFVFRRKEIRHAPDHAVCPGGGAQEDRDGEPAAEAGPADQAVYDQDLGPDSLLVSIRRDSPLIVGCVSRLPATGSCLGTVQGVP